MPSYQGPYQAPPPKQSNPCLTILGIGCLVIVCLALLTIPAYFIFKNQISVVFSSIQSTLEAPSNLPQVYNNDFPTVTPIPPSNPDTPLPSGLTGQQQLTDYSFFDDFSSTSLNWEQSSDEISAYGYDQGGYFIHVKKPSYFSWAQIPVGFTPYEIEFDAQAPMDVAGGSFGVMCQFQDGNNYYNIEIDVANQEFTITMVKNDESNLLISQEWIPISGLNTASGSYNHYAISCYPEWIGLYVNNTMIGEADFSGVQPFSNPGSMALFVSTWAGVGADGYWAYFDNVYAYQPVQ